jgi:hypothetical protein
LQADPIGYGDGMNMYAYCGNNPLVFIDPSGLVQVVTGRYRTMPGLNNYPGKSMPADMLAQVSALIVNLIEISGTDKDPRVKVVEKYFEVMKELAEKIAELHEESVWRTFIEVYDVCDLNGSGLIEENEKSEPYWIEVCGIRMPGRNEPVWLEGGGYKTWEDAADAGGTAVDWALRHGGVIPNNFPSGWLDPEWGTSTSPYVTDGEPYRDSSTALDVTKTINELIDEMQKLLEEIEKILPPE